MKPGEILQQNAHRGFIPPPTWLAYQSWRNVIFLHWGIDQEVIMPYLPAHAGIKPDLYNGKAWLSLVGFEVANARPRCLPPLPGVSFFNELNLRTYVKYGNDHGTVFLHIDADNSLTVGLNRLIGLPYHKAAIDTSEQHLSYRDRHDGGSNQMAVEWLASDKPLAPKSELDCWLTERYATYQQNGNAVHRYPIHHPEWQLQSVELNKDPLSYRWKDLTLTGHDMALAHYSQGVDVLFWMRERI